ncbi:Ger(x)C family spore germination protein [Niallia sp. XMNu-256]|uniref:Ger(x)C family spore germination protein n=1 Tax=Niallia sp. XMNu-256 TaxID=3082444 RepID=UPI0030D33D81
MGRKKRLLILLFICIMILFGCARTRIIDKMSIAHVFGFDQGGNGEIIGTALFPEYTKSKDSDEIQSLEEHALNPSLLISKMSTHTSTPVEIAKIRVILLGNSYAKAGIRDVVERLIVTPRLGTHIQIAAATDSARKALNIFKKEKSLTLYERIQQNIERQNLPRMNLHIFLNHFYGEGMDAYVPMISIDKNDRLTVEGVGVFKDDKLKLHLNQDQTVLFSFIKDSRTQATYKMELDGSHNRGEMIIVQAFQSKQNWDWDQKEEELHCRINLQMSLNQLPNRYNVEKKGEIAKIEKLVEMRIEKGLEELLNTLQRNEVDPIGIGNILRSKDKTWDKESFYKQYPDLPIHVDVNIKITHSGLEG